MDVRKIGKQAEDMACEFLKKKGFELLDRNYRSKMGEIDLIMRKGNDIIFAEVRARNHPLYGDALESVTPYKQAKIIKTAMHYLQYKNWFDKVNCRFDVIAIYQHQCEWIQHAFTIEE